VTAPPAEGRRSRTRQALLAAAEDLFAQHPIDAVAIDDIVRAAKVAKGTFYNHFTDRDDLVRTLLIAIRGRIEATVDAVNAGVEDPARRVVRGVCAYVRYALDEPRNTRILLRAVTPRAVADSRLNRGVLDDLSAGLAVGRFSLATTEAGLLLLMGVSQVAMARAIEDGAVALPIAQQLCGMMLKGLGVAAEEAERIAAQAADEIIRRPV
jgi:AcrR family transcriptional regulator